MRMSCFMSSITDSPLKVYASPCTGVKPHHVVCFTEDTYGKRDALGGCVHALHVHVRPEQSHPTLFVAVRLHALEETVRIVEDGSTRRKRKGSVYRGVENQAENLT